MPSHLLKLFDSPKEKRDRLEDEFLQECIDIRDILARNTNDKQLQLLTLFAIEAEIESELESERGQPNNMLRGILKKSAIGMLTNARKRKSDA